MKKLTWSKLLTAVIIAGNYAMMACCLYLIRLAIVRDFSAAASYLTAAVTASQALLTVVVTAYFQKSKAENTAGGVTYETAVRQFPGEGQSI